MGIGVSEEIPRRACPLRHCVCFALCGASAARTCGIYPIRHLGKRRFTRICRLIRINIGQAERKLTFGNRNITAFFAFNNRNRLAPISLAAEHPVSELEVDFFSALTFLFKPINHGMLSFFNAHAADKTAVYEGAGCAIREGFFLNILAACNNLNNRQIKFLCKFPVAGVVSRNGHNGTGAVRGENII